MRPTHHLNRPQHDFSPIRGDKLAIDDRVAGRNLHPAVIGENPERREHGAERYHAAGEEVDARRDPITPSSITPKNVASNIKAVNAS